MSKSPRVTQDPKNQGLRRSFGKKDRRQVFTVEAISEEDALNVLEKEEGVKDGVTFKNKMGEIDTALFAREFDVRRKSTAQAGETALWEVAVDYVSSSGGSPKPFGPNPDDPVPVYTWGRSEQTQEIEREVGSSGKTIENSLKEPFKPGVQVIVPSRTLQVQWYLGSYVFQDILRFDGVVNSADWEIGGRWTILKGQALSRGIVHVEESVDRILMSWDIEFRPGGLLWSPVNLIDYTWINGNRVKLDGSGEPLTSGSDKYLPFNVYYTEDFNFWGV